MDMELSAKYVYKVYEEKSITKAAKELYISQPALSAAIARVEKELGFQIFDRTTIPLSLTAKGQVYIHMLEDILESEALMRRRIKRLNEVKSDTLSIGGSGTVSYYLLPIICGEFYKRFPDIRVVFDMGNVGDLYNLNEKLQSGELDLLIGYMHDAKSYDLTPLLEEDLIIALPKSLPHDKALESFAVTYNEIIGRNYPEHKKIKDLSVFKNIPFISNINSKMEILFEDYTTAPYSIKNSRNYIMHYNLMRAGIGALLTAQTVVASVADSSEDVLYFVLNNRSAKRTVYISSKAGSPKTAAMKNFIKVAQEVCTTNILNQK